MNEYQVVGVGTAHLALDCPPVVTHAIRLLDEHITPIMGLDPHMYFEAVDDVPVLMVMWTDAELEGCGAGAVASIGPGGTVSLTISVGLVAPPVTVLIPANDLATRLLALTEDANRQVNVDTSEDPYDVMAALLTMPALDPSKLN